ncbi:MAG: hypothetical protein ACU837_08020 [Gammaproteobacteria bacterium]
MMIPDFIQTVIVALTIFIPVCVIYKRAGFHPAWAALLLIPGFGLFLVFLQLALLPWPNAGRRLEHKP